MTNFLRAKVSALDLDDDKVEDQKKIRALAQASEAIKRDARELLFDRLGTVSEIDDLKNLADEAKASFVSCAEPAAVAPSATPTRKRMAA